MAYITNYNLMRLVRDTLQDGEKKYHKVLEDVKGKSTLYKSPIFFFNKYEEDELYLIREFLANPEVFFTQMYKPVLFQTESDAYIFQVGTPAYHADKDCERLNSDFLNIPIPESIRKKGYEAVQEFKHWFRGNVDLYKDNPEVFNLQFRAKYGVKEEIKEEVYKNSGHVEVFNKLTLAEVEGRIDFLLKESGRFYYRSQMHQEVIRKYGKIAFIGDEKYELHNNTGYPDQKIREILRDYQVYYKEPIKSLLFEYFRLKLNPDVIISKQLLADIGFRECNHCGEDE